MSQTARPLISDSLILETLRRLCAGATWTGGIKQLAIEAGCSQKTASRATSRLIGAGRVWRSHFRTHPAPTWRVR
ncbi:MAG: hypothetical protein K2X32_06880 [Phycisphaerales bacterium]|nr:hypothetical protein [Phycisphaerales bacterium]